jgi:hypothetical protein
MTDKPNCVYEHPTKKCTLHSLTSFKHVICAKHLLTPHGLNSIYRESQQPEALQRIGPYLAVAENVVFEPNTVIFPTRDFIDQQLGYYRGDDADLLHNNYRLSKVMMAFLNDMTLENTNAANMFQFEILRNLLIHDPSTDVKMALGADETKAALKHEVQSRLNYLRTFVLNQDWHAYMEGGTNLQIKKQDGTQKTNLSAFEEFLMFNIHGDAISVLAETVYMHRINLNIRFVDKIGYVTVKALYHPADLVVYGVYTVNNHYLRNKVRQELKKCVKNVSTVKRMGDAQDRLKFVDQTDRCHY